MLAGRSSGWLRHGLGILLAGSLCAGLAWGHPFSRDFYSMRSGLRLANGELRAVVVVPMPRGPTNR